MLEEGSHFLFTTLKFVVNKCHVTLHHCSFTHAPKKGAAQGGLYKSFLATKELASAIMSQELVEEVKDGQAPDHPPTAPQLYVIMTGENSHNMHSAPLIVSLKVMEKCSS